MVTLCHANGEKYVVSTTIYLPRDIFFRARELKINKTKIAREAIIKEVLRIEKVRGSNARNDVPASTPIKEVNILEPDTV